MTLISRCVLALVVCSPLGCGESLPPVDTPRTLPPAEPAADVTQAAKPAEGGAGKTAREQEPKPVP